MSAELSPRTPRSRRSTNATRRTTSSQAADDEYRAEYYSGLEEGSSGEEGSGSSSELSDDELPDDDIPVTGFAVASNKRNADFHELFPSVPEGDYLIEGTFVVSCGLFSVLMVCWQIMAVPFNAKS